MTDQKKVRPRQVAAYQSLRPVMVDEAATYGAQIGVNLLLPDGTVGTIAQLAKLFGSTATAGTGTITTTDDVEEGQWNLWFTNLRAQNAVGGILANSANVTLTYVGGTSVTADLTNLTDSGAGALLATTFDAKGRKTGSRAATITGTAGRITVANGDASAGLPTIDLATVADAGGGTLQRFVRDAWGRLSGTSAATTTDLTEGANLYFTAARVLATILAGLSTATNAVITAADSVLSALGKLQAQITDNLLPAGYIDGLKMAWVSATAITVTTGAAYIPGLSRVLRVPASIAKTGLSLTASTWYHVYLYNNAGMPDIEISTTIPDAPYNGTARAKTGDTSRRYIGSVLTDSSGNLNYLVPQERWGWSDFFATCSSSTNQAFTQGSFITVQYPLVTRDVDSEWNTSTNTFTAKQRGLYLVTAFAHPEKLNDGMSTALSVFVNGVETQRLCEQIPRSPTNTNGGQVGSSCVMFLKANDTVTFRLYCGGTSTTAYIDALPEMTYCSVYRMQ